MATRKRRAGQAPVRRQGGAEGGARDAREEARQASLGRSGKKVTSRKQAIAIGLSEARRAGGKVPKPRGRRSASK